MLFVILDLHSACIYGGGLSILKRGCPKSVTAPFAIVYFGKKYYLTVAKTKHYSNG